MINQVTALAKHPTVRNVSILMTGTVGGQLLFALSSPILTRIYSPGEMGVLNVFTGIAAPILAFAALRFNYALQVPEDEHDARSLAHLAFASVIVVAMLTLGVVLLFRSEIASFFSTPELESVLFLLPITVITAGTFMTVTSWSVRIKQFPLIAKARFQQSVAIVALQVGLGLSGTGAWGLMTGDAMGRLVGATSLLRLFRSGSETTTEATDRKRVYWELLKRYRRFPLYSVPPAIMNSVSVNLPTYFLAYSHGPGSVGLFALSQRVLGLPLNVISEAVSQVFLSQAAELRWRSMSALRKRTRDVSLILMALGAIIVVPIAIVGPWVFGLVFGDKWYEAGVYVRALAPMLWAQFSFSPLGAILDILERQDLHAIRETVRMLLLGGALTFLVSYGNTDAAQIVQIFGIMGALSYVFGGALVWLALKSVRSEGIDAP